MASSPRRIEIEHHVSTLASLPRILSYPSRFAGIADRPGADVFSTRSGKEREIDSGFSIFPHDNLFDVDSDHRVYAEP
jgi:hypothetical protein